MRLEDRIYSKGLRFNVWIYFLLFSLLILGLIWMLQIVFLSGYYKALKIREIENLGEALAEGYDFDAENGGINGEYSAKLLRAIEENGLMIVIFDVKNGVQLFSRDVFSGDRTLSVLQAKALLDRVSDAVQAAEGESVVLLDPEETTLEYMAEIADEDGGGSVYFYLRSPLAPVSSAIFVLRDQLILVTAITLMLAFVLSWFISNKLSTPITDMSIAARRLARGDYSVVFEGNGYTEIDELSDTLNYATKELAKTDKLRKDLIANVSHDLRTPLTMIKAYAEMIRDLSGGNAVKRAQHTNVIIEEADRLTALVSDMLSLSKLESFAVPADKRPFDLSALLHAVMQRFTDLYAREGYSFGIDAEEPLIVLGDEPRIEQVLYNLIINAINYTGEDKRVQVALRRSGASAKLSVTDTGSGIPPEELEGIWERYYRASEARKRSSVGTGLGLSIVKNILKSHGTAYGVDSKPGEGSTFWFMLDLASSKED